MWKIIGLAIFAAATQTSDAYAQSATRGYTCAQIREAVVKYGGAKNAEALARAQGGSDREISTARKCLSRPRHFRRS